MLVFYVMLAAIVAARIAGAAGVTALDSLPAATRAGLAVMFVFTGLAHFTKTRHDLVRMVPPQLPFPEALVAITGVAELAGAVALLVPAVARTAAFGLVLLLVLMFPANIYAARTAHTIAGRTHTPMRWRLPLQLLWIALLIWSAPRVA
jgi:uncharacterized membrane protein